MLLPEDVDQTFAKIRRVLTSGGRVLFVEPWRAPFLTFVHFVAERRAVRRLSAKLDTLSTMTHYERDSYEQWLSQPEQILSLARKHFEPLYVPDGLCAVFNARKETPANYI